MNEIMMNNTTAMTGNARLDRAISKIRAELVKGNKANHNVARELNNIKTNELYKAVSETFSDFAENYFGLSKSQASRYTQVADTFLIDNKYDDYTISQLIEMLKATPEQLEYITPLMSCKEIRDFIKGENLIDVTPETETAETETAETAETELEPKTNDETVFTFTDEKELSRFLQGLAKKRMHMFNIKLSAEFTMNNTEY